VASPQPRSSTLRCPVLIPLPFVSTHHRLHQHLNQPINQGINDYRFEHPVAFVVKVAKVELDPRDL
jgi:hypothetical protein